MIDFEKKLMNSLEEKYMELIREYEGAAALHAANLMVWYGRDENKTLEGIVLTIQLLAQMLEVLPGKAEVMSDLPKEQVIKWTPHSDTIQMNLLYLKEKESMEDIRKLLIAVSAAVFVRHVRTVAESTDAALCEYAKKMGWDTEWKNPVDPYENPKLFIEQNYVKAAMGYGIAYAESALLRAEKVLNKLKEQKNG